MQTRLAFLESLGRITSAQAVSFRSVQKHFKFSTKSINSADKAADLFPRRFVGKARGPNTHSRVSLLRVCAMSSSRSTEGPISGLVSAKWLHERLQDPDVKILDGSWYMPNAGRDPAAEFKKERIPGSKFFDVDRVADTSSPLPHMLPSAEAFAAAADSLGIKRNSTVVIYDRAGIFSAPRVWWTFKAFGHSKVAVLNGGYPAWQGEGYEIDSSPASQRDAEACARAAASPPAIHQYKPEKQDSLIRDWRQVLANIDSHAEAVVDARGAARFNGTAPEPRKGIRGGHIPGSLNVPFDSLLADGRYKSKEDLQKVFSEAGVQWNQPIVTSCGTGVTASVLALGLYTINSSLPVAVYDGSWTEWGGREDTPIDTAKE